MEKMQISVLSVREQRGQVVARARGEARDATIHVEVRFTPAQRFVRADLWQEARDRVLALLDMA